MTLNEFLDAFKNVAQRFEAHTDKMIRRRGDSETCPVTAVCFDHTGKIYHCAEVKMAGKLLKLDTVTLNRIVQAADCTAFRKNQRMCFDPVKDIRDRMLNIINETQQ